MKKRLFTIFTICCFMCALASAQEVSEEQTVEVESLEEKAEETKDFTNHIVPVLGFETLQLEEKDFVFTPSAALQFIRTKNASVESKQPDAIVLLGSYSQSILTKGIGKDEIKNFHSVNLMGNVGFGKNSIVAMLSSTGQAPFSSIDTITAGLLYSRQIFKNDSFNFSLGAGILAGGLGIKIWGWELYVIPLPTLSFSYKSQYFNGSISCMGLPSLSITLFPKAPVRVRGECGISGFDSIRDLTFDCAVVYYPLSKTKAGDFLSLSAGVMNKKAGFNLYDSTKYSMQYYCAYGEINASFVTLRAGYNFDGRKTVSDGETTKLYKGVFASIQALYMF